MEQEILSGLVARGLPLHVAQGITANLIAESGLNPGINEIAPLVPGSRGGYGLAQWTGPRRTQYEGYARDRGSDLADTNAQLDFLLWELNNTERGAWNALQGTSDARSAAQVFSDKFLRPGIPHMDRRLAEAERLSGVNPGGNALASMSQPQQQQNALSDWTFQPNYLDPAAFMRNA